MTGEVMSSVLIMAVLILMSAYFSATETAFSSLNRTRLRTLAEKGNRKASLALSLSEQYDRMLSTILIGNNIVNIATASIGTVLFVHLYGDAGATISTVVITIVVLIFGEISPKSLAKENPERFAMFSARILKACIWLLTPVNFLFTQWKKLLSKLFHVSEDRKMTQDELLMLVEEVRQDGSVDEDEGNLLRSAVEFTDRDAGSILTPRVDLVGVPITATKEHVADVFSQSRYSRLLVYDGSIDSIVGVIHQKDFYVGTGVTEKGLADIMTPPIFVPSAIKIRTLLGLLQKNKSHIAIVSDEYGGTVGIVTMEDILEELVGEIWDEHDEVVENFREVEDGVFHVVCSADFEQMRRHFHLGADCDCAKVSGWVMEQLGRIPHEGDRFLYDHLLVTVLKADSRRALEIEVRKIDSLEDLDEELSSSAS